MGPECHAARTRPVRTLVDFFRRVTISAHLAVDQMQWNAELKRLSCQNCFKVRYFAPVCRSRGKVKSPFIREGKNISEAKP